MATELYDSVAERPLVSVHNGLPARFLAEDVPFTDPISLLVSHDQGVQALLRAHGIRAEFSAIEGWQTGRASRQAFALLWQHMVDVQSRPWMVMGSDEISPGAELPPFRTGQDPDEVYDELAARLADRPLYPRRVLAAAHIGRFATSDDPADDLQAHQVLAEDPALDGPGDPDLQPRSLPGPRTAQLAYGRRSAGRDDRRRHRGARGIPRGAESATRPTSRHAAPSRPSTTAPTSRVTRLSDREAGQLYGLARSGELLPTEAMALDGHLLWEIGRMAADDGLMMALYPPAGFHAGALAESGSRRAWGG